MSEEEYTRGGEIAEENRVVTVAKTAGEHETEVATSNDLSNPAPLRHALSMDHGSTGDRSETECRCGTFALAAWGKKGFGISHSTYKIRKWKIVWAAVCKGSSFSIDEWTDLSRDANDEVIGTDVNRTDGRKTMMIDIYDQRVAQTTERKARKIHWHKVFR